MKEESAVGHRFLTRNRFWWLLLAGSLLVLWPVQRGINRNLTQAADNPESLYLTSGATLRRLAMGYDGLLADIYWTRAVQYFGRRRLARATSFDLLGPLLQMTTALDPHLLIAYRFGAIFLAEKPPEGTGDPQQALQLVRRGIVANPDYWRFWQDIGFIYYWDLKDYKMAARAFETGSRQPGALVWMQAMAATVAAQGGERRTSRLLWSEIYQSAETATVRQSALKHLEALQAEEDVAQLNALAAQYQKEQGSRPNAFGDLIRAGYLKAIPLDPSGMPYVLKPDGEIGLGPGTGVDQALFSTATMQAHP